MEIRKVAVSYILEAPEFPALIREYEAESAVDGLPDVDVKMEDYRLLEVCGQLPGAFQALDGEEMVGFITVALSGTLHFSAPLAVTKSFFVGKDHRKGGAGLRLLAAAETLAKLIGSPGLFVCAPMASRLIEVLPRRGYTATNVVYFKGFASVH